MTQSRGLIELDIVKAREVAKLAAKTLKPLRTEHTIRTLAKEFAAAWWDESTKLGDGVYATQDETEFAKKRSDMFRAMWPDQRIYVSICWPHFYKIARKQMISMLDVHSGTSEVMKARIFDAIIEDREKGN